METAVWILAVLMVAAGLAGVILPALPGAPLVFAGLFGIAWVTDFQRVGWPTLLTLGVLTALSYAVDFLTVSLGAKKFGATRQAAIGAAIGMVVGLFFGIPGLFFGPFVGAFAGELLSIGNLRQAGLAGVGTWLGLLFGVVLKLALVFAMIGLFIAAYFL